MKAAFEVFVTYGFRKTSMDDIARSAQMSRPALYQLFKNKTDIFRALSEELMGHAAGHAKAALSGPGAFRERLFGALDNSILTMLRILDDTPHGSELMGVNREIAFDIEEKWIAILRGVFQDAMTRAEKAGEVRFRNTSAEETARVLMHAMEGIKQDYMRGAKVEAYVISLVTFIADAITTEEPVALSRTA